MAADGASGNFGSRLREARERRGVTLREIAGATKISVGVLEALERNDISKLPGGIFGRAFVRSFATEVGLDPEKTIQEFLAEFPQDSVVAGHPTARQVEDSEAFASERQAVSTFLRLVGVSVPLALILLYFSAGRPTPPAPPPAVQVQTPPGALAAPGDPMGEDRSREAAAAAVTDQVLVADRASVSDGGRAADSLRVALTATRVCWVSMTVDGDKPLRRLLQAGEGETLEVRRELVLTTGDAAALTMTINGVAAKPLGKPGEVVTARVSLANFSTYLPAP